jgi:dienelactone hydrolase
MDSLRESLTSFLRFSSSAPTPKLHEVERTREADYDRSLVWYEAPDGDRIEAFLFEPVQAPRRGGILALHQHNSQWSLGKSEIAGLAGDPLQAFGPALARAGVTVLAPDAVAFESRSGAAGWGTSLAPALHKSHSRPEGWLDHYNQMAHRLVKGDLLMRKVLTDSATALSVLRHLDEVDPASVGVLGHSYGGSVALFLAALDVRVAFACSSGAACSYAHKLEHGTALEMSLVIPNFLERFEIVDLLRCVAPRRLLIVSSEDDPHSADATDLVRDALPAFIAHGFPGHLEHLRVPGSHELDQRRYQAILAWAIAQAKQLPAGDRIATRQGKPHDSVA